MKKVLILTYYWPPAGGSGVQRWVKLVKYLPEFGVEPFVLTVDPGFAYFGLSDQTLESDINPNLKVITTKARNPFAYFSAVSGKDQIPFAGFANAGKPTFIQKIARFIRGNFFIPDPRIGWNRYALKAAMELIQREGIDTVITTSPPHSTQLVGLTLKKKLGIRWMADLRDPWTGIYYMDKFYRLPFAKKLDARFERKVLEEADTVISVGETLSASFKQIVPSADPLKFLVIPNGFDSMDFPVAIPEPSDEFIISFSGIINESLKPGTFLLALKESMLDFPEVKFKLRFFGAVAQDIKALIASAGIEKNVEFLGQIPHKEAVKKLTESSALLLLLASIGDEKSIVSGKLFEYLGARKPVIGIGPPDGDAAKILNECNGGKFFSRTQKEELKDYLSFLVKEWKKNPNLKAGNSLVENYSRKSLAEKMAKVILKN